MRFLTPLLVLSLAGSAATQTLVSPKRSAGNEGVSCSSHLFKASTDPNAPRAGRYQQIHTDTKGSSVMVTSMSHRQDGQCSSGKMSLLEIEVVMAHATAAAATSTFTSNYKGSPTTVFTKKKVSPPSWSGKPSQSPAPWDLKIVFDAPFSYNGTDDLLWEQRKTACVASTADVWSDYDFDISTDRGVWGWKIIGKGCTASTRTSPMSHTTLARSEVSGSSPRINLWVSVSGAPSSASSALLIGVVDPNLALAGLCERIHSDGTIVIPKTAATSGIFGTTNGEVVAPYNPGLVGANLYTQGASLDPGRSDPIKVALSNGLEHTIAPLQAGDVKMVRLLQFSSATAATGLLVKNTGVIVTKFN